MQIVRTSSTPHATIVAMQAHQRGPFEPDSNSQTDYTVYGPSANDHDGARALVAPDAA